jgi:hypothetical protein
MEIYFCDLCDESIPVRDIQERRAGKTGGKVVCARCLREVRTSRKVRRECRRTAETGPVAREHSSNDRKPRSKPSFIAKKPLERSFQFGTRALGVVLLVLGVLSLIGTVRAAVVLRSGDFRDIAFLFIAPIVVYLFLGIMALRCHNWVNWSSLVIALLSFVITLPRWERDPDDMVAFFGVAIGVGTAVLTIRNLLMHRRVIQAHLNPRMGLHSRQAYPLGHQAKAKRNR